jgi:hypothetical protein
MIRRTVLSVLTLAVVVSVASAQNKLVVFSGTVVDAAKKPLENAEISVPGVNLTKTTDDKGVFRMETVTSGVHRVTVRKIGYAQLDTAMIFPEDQEVVWRVTMTEKIVTLDSVLVRAPRDVWMEEFDSNRKRGFGQFMDRDELAKMDGVPLPTVLRRFRGAEIIRTNNSSSYIVSKRAPMSGCPPPLPAANPRAAMANQEVTDECLRRERIYYVPDGAERQFGVKRACYPQVWMDRQLMNPGRPTMPFDLATFSATREIEAVEWYESESQTPPRYGAQNARCGVLVIHVKKKQEL